MANPLLSIIQGGKLFSLELGRLTEHLSPFAQEKVSQETRDTSRHTWKSGDDGSGQQIFSRSQLWGGKGDAPPVRPPRFVWVLSRGTTLWYVLSLSRTRGLFRYDPQTGRKRGCFITTDLIRMDSVSRLTAGFTPPAPMPTEPCISCVSMRAGRQNR